MVAVGLVGYPLWSWYDSVLPKAYSVTDGPTDLGGGPDPGQHDRGVSVADLTGDTAGTPDVAMTFIARKERFRLASGEGVDGFTLNRQSPGPLIRVCQGQLLEVVLVNESVPDGVTLHWHGVDVPNAMDGVAGVTQDAVTTGKRFVYRFRPPEAGTYWYHSHQISDPQVRGGLLGALIVQPRDKCGAQSSDAIAIVHTYGDYGSINGRTGVQRVAAAPGSTTRVRVVNTENSTLTVAVFGADFRVLAVDGGDIIRPPVVRARTMTLPAGGRVDLGVIAPADGSAARIDVGAGGGAILAVGPPSGPIAPLQALAGKVDFLSYGEPAALGFDPARADRRFEYRIGRRYGFFNGRLGNWWTVNGKLSTDVPMFMVNEGDVVVFTISNSSGSAHPMHLHGHHAVVIERNGVKATGSPWRADTVDVERGATYVIAFVADNPGVWMDHCHNLTHAAQGLVAHLGYFGVTDPFVIGSSGTSQNHPQ